MSEKLSPVMRSSQTAPEPGCGSPHPSELGRCADAFDMALTGLEAVARDEQAAEALGCECLVSLVPLQTPRRLEVN